MKADDPAVTGSLEQDAMTGETGSRRDKYTSDTSFLTGNNHSPVRQRTTNQRALNSETEAPETPPSLPATTTCRRDRGQQTRESLMAIQKH